MTCSSRSRQRGGASLLVTIVLLFVMTLIAAFANRNLVFAERISANQYRATRAFEAAEAGVEWTLAMLNNGQPLGAGCRPGSAAGDRSFRERFLRYDTATATHAPVTWNNGSTTEPLRSACVRAGDGWACGCPSSGHPAPAAPTDDGLHAAFVVQFERDASAGLLQLIATGCTGLAGPCAPGGGTSTDASARVQVAVGLVPGLVTPPAAPLTVRDSVDAGAAALGLHNADAESVGLAVHAGAAVVAPAARITSAPGGVASQAMVEHDASLRALGPDQFFATYFRLSKTAWRDQPAATRVVCHGNCSATLIEAIGDGTSNRLIWIDGDLQLDAPLVLGTRERPVILVATGAVELRGPIAIHGLVYAAAIEWNDSGSGAMLRGAAIAEGGYSGNGAPDFVYDAAVLAALRGNTGSFARVPGSWKDF